MSLHKLTAGDGYAYLTRQVAALDATDKGHTGLADYYSQRGESPGRWIGKALADVDMVAGQDVTADQMASLFAEGRHPNADSITAELIRTHGRPLTPAQTAAATGLGRPFPSPEATPAFQIAVARRAVEVNVANGARGDTMLAASERARIRTEVGRELFTEAHGRPPMNPRELSSFIARNSRSTSSAVAGFDLTFTPVKSVSALWAIAPREIADQITAAHHAAVGDVLGWLEQEAAYTRGGRHGVQQLDTTGLLAATFDHRDSRAGDPDLHTHVAVSSKVRVRNADGTPGRWLALDGRVLFKATVAASERYNTRIEVELGRRLGLTFAPRADAAVATAAGKREVREVVGVPEELSQVWSQRRERIDVRRAELAAKFQAEHGRPPTPVEAVKLAQQATLETREAKHAARSEAQQRATWRAEAAAVLGSQRHVDRIVDMALAPDAPVAPEATDRTPSPSLEKLVDVMATAALAKIETSRSTWQVWHVRSEAERQVRTNFATLATLAPATGDLANPANPANPAKPANPDAERAAGWTSDKLVDQVVDQVVAMALHPDRSIALTRPDRVHATIGSPALLQRRDGSSVYDVAGSQTYTSAAVLADETFLVDVAQRRDGRAVDSSDVDLALLESVTNGLNLNTAQAHLVREMATSGARVQLAIAPAGSGKTTAMSALAAAWTHGGGNVIGLAPSAVAASVLREEIGAHADTLASLVFAMSARSGRSAMSAMSAGLPDYAETINDKTLLVVDEAGMASTTDLAAVARFALERGASVRLVGDDRQLASVAAGGVLRDIQASGGAVTLTELVRFRDQAEAAAGLAVREGDTTGLGFYIDNDRVHVGDLTTVTDHAYQAWTADRDDGLDSIMLAPTREIVTGLNLRARTDRLARAEDERPRPSTQVRALQPAALIEVALADGSAASAGDTIITRRNDRRLRTSTTDFVKNGDRWTVTTAHTRGKHAGSLEVVHIHTGRRLQLPADYVKQHVQLGYATTVHGAQGVTADTSHTVTVGEESRQQLYVAITRGRQANHVYLNAAMDGDEHSLITPAATHPLTAVNMLEQILARDEAQPSATTTAARANDAGTALTDATARYLDALHTAAADLLGRDRMTSLEAAVDQLAPGTLTSPAWPTLRGHLVLLAAEGQQPEVAFAEALQARQIDTAADVAAVLDWRLDPTHTRSTVPGPAAWLPGIPAVLRAHPVWGQHLTARQDQVAQATRAVRDHASALTTATVPAWGRQMLTPERQDLLADLLVFRAAHGITDDDTRPTGPRQQAAASRRAQASLNTRVNAAIDTSYRTAWTPIAEQAGLTPAADPHWPVLAENLAALSRAGADAPSLLRKAAAEAPLPDEYQAAAVWWRIARHVSPAVLTPDPAAAAPDPLRPIWLEHLTAALDGEPDPDENEGRDGRVGVTAQLLQDPRWPAVITALTRASEHGISYADLFRRPVGLDGEPVPAHALADALIYRATVLTDPEPYSNRYLDAHDTPPTDGLDAEADAAPPPDPYDDDLIPPEDLHMAPTLHGDFSTGLPSAFDSGTPIGVHDNLDQPPLNYSDPDERRDTPLAALPPLDEDTLPVDEIALTETELDQELYWATTRRATYTWEPGAAQLERTVARAAAADLSPVSPERIADLNEQATVFYQATYRGSWAQTYLTDRLGGVDLTGDPLTRPGYAPNTWTALTDHLRRHGATDDELLAAGLAKQASTGRLIDVFRDRLVLPIQAATPRHLQQGGAPQTQVVGFVSRRHPEHDRLEPGTDAAIKAGPKYLNTGETVLFAKGDQLYGLAEHADRLAAGAAPVIVEGPIDALAVTLASPGSSGISSISGSSGSSGSVRGSSGQQGHVGLSPLGTALTDTQADSLLPHLKTNAHPNGATPVVATDADRAGHAAAAKDYWILTARGADPAHLNLPAGHDPASLLRAEGAAALAGRLLHSTRPLAGILVEERLNVLPPADALPQAAAVIAASHPTTWRRRGTVVADRLHLPVAVALTELVTHAGRWDSDRHHVLETQLEHTRDIDKHRAESHKLPATQRWAPLARQVDPVLVRDAAWPPLAEAFAEAAAAGYDVPTLLRDVLTQGPLDGRDPSRDLRTRMVADIDPSAAPTPALQARPQNPRRPGHEPLTTPPTRPRPAPTRSEVYQVGGRASIG